MPNAAAGWASTGKVVWASRLIGKGAEQRKYLYNY